MATAAQHNKEIETALHGLARAVDVEELADQLTHGADQLRARLKKELAAYKGAPVPEAQQTVLRALNEAETILRLRADGLYADAAALVVTSLGQSQQRVVALTAAAAEKIRKIGMIGGVTGLVGGLIGLAGAAATGQAAPIVLALENIGKQLKTIEAHRKPA